VAFPHSVACILADRLTRKEDGDQDDKDEMGRIEIFCLRIAGKSYYIIFNDSEAEVSAGL
jgi:hypothetical protein